MRDVAALAGVSQSTVSFVVNGRSDMRIADDTRDRVQAAVRELGFRPNFTARAFRTGRTHTIGMMTDQIASSPFAGRIALGAQEAAWRRGSVLLMINSGKERIFDPAAVESLLDRNVDGLIFATLSPERIDIPVTRELVPTVLLNCYAAPAEHKPAILPREVHGGYLAARTVLDAGHRAIVYLAGDYPSWATRLRVRGFKLALREANVPFSEKMVVYGAYDPQFGFEGLRAVMKRRSRPTAILCANDRVALGAFFAAHELGIEIPTDLSVVGYDDQEDLADGVHPGLTTVSLPHFDMGFAAVDAITAARGGTSLAARQWFEGSLIERESVTAPPSRR